VADDKKQIGLTAAGQSAIEEIMQSGLFATEMDIYRFGIAYAIAVELEIDHAPAGGYLTKFNASGGVDSDDAIRSLLEVLEVGDRARPYATAEKLAELGVTDVARRLRGNEGMADIMSSVSE
jgi:hypothetical protein